MRDAKERFKEIRISNELSQKEFAEKLGTSQGVISDIEHGRKGISRNVLLALGTEFNINATWVLTGESDMFLPRQISAFKTAEQTINSVNEAIIKNAESIDETITPPQELNQNDFVVPILDQSLSAGKGQPLPDDDNPIGYIAVPKELKRYGNKLAAIYVNGDSMEPTLQRGDLVVCDSCGWDGDGIYALRMDGCGYVKRLARKPGKLVVISDNPKYETWEESTESEAVSIIGRVHYTLKHVD